MLPGNSLFLDNGQFLWEISPHAAKIFQLADACKHRLGRARARLRHEKDSSEGHSDPFARTRLRFARQRNCRPTGRPDRYPDDFAFAGRNRFGLRNASGECKAGSAAQRSRDSSVKSVDTGISNCSRHRVITSQPCDRQDAINDSFAKCMEAKTFGLGRVAINRDAVHYFPTAPDADCYPRLAGIGFLSSGPARSPV